MEKGDNKLAELLGKIIRIMIAGIFLYLLLNKVGMSYWWMLILILV